MDTIGTRTQDVRDSVKWIATTAIGVASAIASATVVSRIATAPKDNLTVCIVLTIAALALILVATAVCAWAVTVPEAALRQLMPDLAKDPAQPVKPSRSARRLAADLEQIGPVASFKYSDLSVVAEQLSVLQKSRMDAFVQSARPGGSEANWQIKLAELDLALTTTYEELSDIAADLRHIKTRRRARVALPLIAALCLIAEFSMIPFALLSQPGPEPALISEATNVNFEFKTSPTIAGGPNGCEPGRTGVATAVGGTWSRPVLVFRAATTIGGCAGGQIWEWTSTSDFQVVISPQ